MTKSWEDVREQACQLYRSGRPLREVRERLKREHNFTASERAFRMKLKEWNVKRTKCQGDCVDHVEGSHEEETMPAISERFSQPQQFLIEQALPSMEWSEAVPAQIVPAPIFYSNGSHASFGTPTEWSLHYVYLQLEDDNSMSNMQKVLANAGFNGSLECILHYAAARQNSSILDALIRFAQLNGLDIDVKNDTGQSALEVAIHSRKLENVELLLTGGASVQCNQKGQTPLHVALLHRADWLISGLLLRYGADPNIPMVFNEQLKTPLELASQIDNSQALSEAENQIRTIRALLRAGAIYHPLTDSGAKAYVCVLHHFGRYLASTCDPTETFMDCLRMFWERRWDAFVTYPEKCGCRTLAQLVFSHIQHSALSRLLIDSIDLEKYGHLLVETIILPCKTRVLRQSSLPQHALLQILLTKEFRPKGSRNPISIALARASEDESMALVRTLLKFDKFDIHQWDPVYGRPLEILPTFGPSLRWQLAESILDQDLVPRINSSAGKFSNKKFPLILIHDFKTAYLRYGEPAFRAILTDYLLANGRQANPPYYLIEECLRCVIHVITKHIIDDISASGHIAVEKQRLTIALEMRRKYQLPDINISSRLLLSVVRDESIVWDNTAESSLRTP